MLSGGKRISSKNFSIVFSKTERGYAVVVSKKVARLSVARHKIKRRVSAALRELNLPQALIVFPRSSVSSVSYKETEIELANLISKINNITNL